MPDYLESCAEDLGLNRPGIKIIELGSGVGWLGMFLSANLPHANMVLCTEQADGGAVAWLDDNIARNNHLQLRNLQTTTCDWSTFDRADVLGDSGVFIPDSSPEGNTCLNNVQWDYILGSDLVYNEEGTELLPKVINALTGPNTVVLYCHTKRRFEHMDFDFLEHLSHQGLAYSEVRESWAPSPGTSPEAFTELYPDMRIAIYKICRLQP